MSDVTRLLDLAQAGDRIAASELLLLVYEELRKTAAVKMAAEAHDHTLNATALVHEAYLRLVGPADSAQWANRRHFFSAAAEAMRRILVESARRRMREKHGGGIVWREFDQVDVPAPEASDELLALDEALHELEVADAEAAKLVSLRYFAGMTNAQAAEQMNLSPRTADRLWAYARAFLHSKIY